MNMNESYGNGANEGERRWIGWAAPGTSACRMNLRFPFCLLSAGSSGFVTVEVKEEDEWAQDARSEQGRCIDDAIPAANDLGIHVGANEPRLVPSTPRRGEPLRNEQLKQPTLLSVRSYFL